MSEQLTNEDVSRMYRDRMYAELETARTDGRLATILGAEPPIPADQEITAADVRKLFVEKKYSQIEALRVAGRLAKILNPTEGN